MNTRNVTNTAFTSYPVSGFEFPNNRQLTNTYDVLYRRNLVRDYTNDVDVAAWQFFGPSRVAEVTLGNGLICTWMNNARTNSAVQPMLPNPAWGDQSSDRLGYDGAGRAIAKRYLAGGINGSSPYNYLNTSSVVGFTTEYDLASNKFFERHLHAEERSHLYEPFSNGSPTGGYDSLSRLRQYQRGILTSNDGFAANGGGSVATPITLPNANSERTYDLDSLGNWRRTNYTVVVSPDDTFSIQEVRQHNGLNQIARVSEGGPPTNFSYDGVPGASNGNLANDGLRGYIWDALSRLVVVNKTPNTSPTLIASYAHDALNRRIRKKISNGGLWGTIPDGTTDCIYSGWRCVEERNPLGGGGDTTTAQYVWGIYLDELLQIYAYVDFGSQPLASGAYYPLQDLLYRTMALTNSSGAIVEAYDTDAYGNTLIFNAPGTDSNWWADDAATADYPACPFIFTGQRFDSETQIYYYKRRYFAPRWGRFISKDSVLQPSYRYAEGQPLTFLDPSGLVAYLSLEMETQQDINALRGHNQIIEPDLARLNPPPENHEEVFLDADETRKTTYDRTCSQLGIWIGKRRERLDFVTDETISKLPAGLPSKNWGNPGKVVELSSTYNVHQTWDIFVKWKCRVTTTDFNRSCSHPDWKSPPYSYGGSFQWDVAGDAEHYEQDSLQYLGSVEFDLGQRQYRDTLLLPSFPQPGW